MPATASGGARPEEAAAAAARGLLDRDEAGGADGEAGSLGDRSPERGSGRFRHRRRRSPRPSQMPATASGGARRRRRQRLNGGDAALPSRVEGRLSARGRWPTMPPCATRRGRNSVSALRLDVQRHGGSPRTPRVGAGPLAAPAAASEMVMAGSPQLAHPQPPVASAAT
ncbi:hypothetical protein PVAP13_5NG161700 [Panicum virgatum]|uniref:Uncharacterized protein n=1 Tax=Panicum virgatum TaxID=38727 RepID=A0A8T0RQU9_PANVG|nr:hypothetical protein PVAP13_5NG161700 [Panicum virgatum]